MRTRQPRWVAFAAALALTLAACGGAAGSGGMDHQGGHPRENTTAAGASPEHGHDQPAPAPIEGAAETTVRASAFRFEPTELSVPAGRPINVALTSTDMLHDFTVEGQDFHLAANANQTTTGALTIDQPGTYTVFCSVTGHREAGMELVLTVEQV